MDEVLLYRCRDDLDSVKRHVDGGPSQGKEMNMTVCDSAFPRHRGEVSLGHGVLDSCKCVVGK